MRLIYLRNNREENTFLFSDKLEINQFAQKNYTEY